MPAEVIQRIDDKAKAENMIKKQHNQRVQLIPDDQPVDEQLENSQQVQQEAIVGGDKEQGLDVEQETALPPQQDRLVDVDEDGHQAEQMD